MSVLANSLLIGTLVETVVGWLASLIGLNGLAVAGLVGLTVLAWYTREVADVLAAVAGYSRLLAYVAGTLAVVLLVGTVTGIVDLSSGGSLISQLIRGVSAALAIHR